MYGEPGASMLASVSCRFERVLTSGTGARCLYAPGGGHGSVRLILLGAGGAGGAPMLGWVMPLGAGGDDGFSHDKSLHHEACTSKRLAIFATET